MTEAAMTDDHGSPYLNRPMRTEEQARADVLAARLGPHERLALSALIGAGEYLLTFRDIANRTDLSERQARRATRKLVRNGLADLSPAFNEDDGTLMGSGYEATALGNKAHDAINAALREGGGHE